MRSITESITRIRTLIRDTRSQTWTDAQIKAYMADAASRIGDMMLEYPNVQRLLRTCGPVLPMVNYQMDYPLQSDCKEIQFVDSRVDIDQYTVLTGAATTTVAATWAALTNCSFAWYVDGRTVYVYNLSLAGAATMAAVATKIQTAFRAASGGTETIEWDTDHFECHGYTDCGYMTAAASPYTGTDLSSSTWMATTNGVGSIAYTVPTWSWNTLRRGDPISYPDVQISALSVAYPPEGTGYGMYGFRWCPADQPGYFRVFPQPSVTNMLIRTRYLKTPRMPANDAQGWPGLPDGFDTLVEYYTASEMGLLELEDGKPIANYAGMFENQFRIFCNAYASLDRPQRLYVKSVNGSFNG